MGYYINHNSQGGTLGLQKVDALIEDGATRIPPPTAWSDDLVCVVDNGIFEAAGYAYSPEEMQEFLRPDGRNKIWLKHPKAKELAK